MNNITPAKRYGLIYADPPWQFDNKANTKGQWGRRGRPRRQNAGIRQIIHAPRGEHSEKPAEARDRLLLLMGDVPRIELFARSRHWGWDAWGAEAPK